MLLAVNLGVLVYVLLRPGQDATLAPTGVAATAETVALPDIATAVQPGTATGIDNRTPVEAASPPAMPEPEEATFESEVPAATAPDTAQEPEDTAPLHIDLHVYSDNPAERFVFINMNQYRENSSLSEGPRVRRITPEGVLLEHRGTTFLLPRD